MDKLFDTVIKNARVVRPNKASVDCLDIAMKDGKIARLGPDIQADSARQVFDAKNRLAFPGCTRSIRRSRRFWPIQHSTTRTLATAP